MRRYQVEVTTEGAEEDRFLQVLQEILAAKRVHLLHVEDDAHTQPVATLPTRPAKVEDLPEPFRSLLLGQARRQDLAGRGYA